MPRIYVAGHKGLVGSALVKAIGGICEVVTRSRDELNLEDQASVNRFFEAERVSLVFMAAAHVGGVVANMASPADFIEKNLKIQTNVITAAHDHGVKRLFFFGSSCAYPRMCPQPMKEDDLLTGPPEPTNRAYAIAKIAGIELCRAYKQQYSDDFFSLLPSNLYGNSERRGSDMDHVIPALLARFHAAKMRGDVSVRVFGTGEAKREFLHVDDLARACVMLMDVAYLPSVVNVGSGEEVSVGDLAMLIKDVVGYKGEIVFDRDSPDGMPRKLMDSSFISGLGWRPLVRLEDGIRGLYVSGLARGR